MQIFEFADVQTTKVWRTTWFIMGVLTVFVFLSPYANLRADTNTVDQHVFYIERNKNRNLVQYVIRMLPLSCQAASDEPVFGYWRDLEEGPDVTSPLLWYEKPAYGFKSQAVKGNVVYVRLSALPERTIALTLSKNNSTCLAQATTKINGQIAIVKQVYVFAEEGFFRPTVKWIEIRGTLSGKAITERIVVD